jgi:MFS family permease
VAAYLATCGWTQGYIGAVLTVQTVASMLFQLPAGMLVDRVSARRGVLAGGIAILAASALLMAMFPRPAMVATALVLQSLGGAVLTPTIVALSLGLAGSARLGERLGRNARFGAIGSGAGAAAMGVAASLLSERAVFFLAALLALPALYGSLHLAARPAEAGPVTARNAAKAVKATLGRLRPGSPQGSPQGSPLGGPRRARIRPIPLRQLVRDRRLWVFAACAVLFHASSAAVLVVAAADITRRTGNAGGLFVAAFILVPQLVVAVLSPAIGRTAQRLGRHWILLLGYASLPLRAAAFALVSSPSLLVPIQLLEGAAAAIYGVLLPLVAADLTAGTGRTNLYLGALGLCGASGAALSTLIAGGVAGMWDKSAAFWVLGALGVAAVALVALAMPETRRAEIAEAV